MIYCVCNASFKIFTIPNEISSDEIEDFVESLFPESSKITVRDLIKKCKEDKRIINFMDAIRLDNNYNHFEAKEKE